MRNNNVRRISMGRSQQNASPRGMTSIAKSKTGLPRFSDVVSAVTTMRPSEALYCLHPDALAQSAALFLGHFPGKSYYAVKSNPDPYVLSHLYAAGINHFDVASLGEVKLIRGMFPDANLAFMHPVKSREAIRAAYFDYGVRVFVLDTLEELRKIEAETKSATDLTLLVRLAMPKGSAAHPLSGKFGASPDLTVELLGEVRKVARRTGIAFHVGSQTVEPASYTEALQRVGEVIRRANITLDILDVGGGFPISGIGMDVRPLTDYFDSIRQGLAALELPKTCDVWCEPGAGLSGYSGTTVVRVEMRKDNALYINDGMHGSLFDLCMEGRRNDVQIIRAESRNAPADVTLKPFHFHGPTCESHDHMPGPFMLPDDIMEGDWIAISGLGGYGLTFRTNYNGFCSDLRAEIREIPPKLVRLRPRQTKATNRI